MEMIYVTQAQYDKMLQHSKVISRDGDTIKLLTNNRVLMNQNIEVKDTVTMMEEYSKENIACFRIKVPIFVARQFMRHRSFSYLEMSRRYTKGSKVPFEFWFPEYFSVVNKNNMIRDYLMNYEILCSEGYETQVASRFLPQTTYTEFYMMGSSEGLRNYFNLRCDSHAQKEIRDLSLSMLQLLYKHQPEFYIKVVPNDEIDKSIRKA
jgi:flavin-dependent thymidylate synthase